jgi:hypothetical protein
MRSKIFRNSITVGENTSKAYFDRTFSTMTPNMNHSSNDKKMPNIYGSVAVLKKSKQRRPKFNQMIRELNFGYTSLSPRLSLNSSA